MEAALGVTVACGNGGPELQLLRSEQPKPLKCSWSKCSWDLFLSEGSDHSDGLQKDKAEMHLLYRCNSTS